MERCNGRGRSRDAVCREFERSCAKIRREAQLRGLTLQAKHLSRRCR